MAFCNISKRYSTHAEYRAESLSMLICHSAKMQETIKSGHCAFYVFDSHFYALVGQLS